MSLLSEEKANIIAEYGLAKNDTGSVQVQVALLTQDIQKLTEHFKVHKKDRHSRQGLLRKVNLRRKLLAYIKRQNLEAYRQLISRLNLRG